MKIFDKIYFSKGAVEIVGVIVDVEDSKLQVRGVELGRGFSVAYTMEIAYLAGIRILSELEWQARLRDEPALKHSI